MPKKVVQLSVADNLCKLASEFESGDKVMSAAIRREFKVKSKNDLTRTVVYLMEIIGSRDEQFKALQRDNTDLKEILKLHDINLEEEYDKLDKKEKVDGTTSSVAGSNGMATTGTNQDLGTGGATVNSSTADGTV
jgi:hypothetical protein